VNKCSKKEVWIKQEILTVEKSRGPASPFKPLWTHVYCFLKMFQKMYHSVLSETSFLTYVILGPCQNAGYIQVINIAKAQNKPLRRICQHCLCSGCTTRRWDRCMVGKVHTVPYRA
jgi:hypothetical protein